LKIEATVDFATASEGYRTGETYDVPLALGKQWIAANWATEVKPPKAKSKRKAI